MNRDERRVRAAEKPPALWNEPVILAPRDGQSQGTWIGVRQSDGHWAALLNGYQDGEEIKQSGHSRGEIVPQILSRANPVDGLYTLDASKYPSFRLITGYRDRLHELWWDGKTKPVYTAHDVRDGFMRTSSSWCPSEVTQKRMKLYDAWKREGRPQSETGLPLFHLIKDNDARWSPFMERESSMTKSLTMFIVNHHTPMPVITTHYYTADTMPFAQGLPRAA